MPCGIPKPGQVCIFSADFFSMWALVSVTGLLIELASLFADHGLQGVQASVVMARGLSSCDPWTLEHGLSSCDTRAQSLHGMWGLFRSGIEPRSPALAGRFFTSDPAGKPQN